MLIRLATKQDIPIWKALSNEYDSYISEISTDFSKWYQGFDEYMSRKIEQSEALIAVERTYGQCNGGIAFSCAHNRITFFAVSRKANHEKTAELLLWAALRQLNPNLEITTNLPASNTGHLLLDQQFFENNGFILTKEVIIDGCPMVELIRQPKNNKWVQQIIELQHDDGSWGYFHSLSQPTKAQPITTEQALRRLRILGLTKNDEPIKLALQYMRDCLRGNNRPPDRREKVLNWDAFEAHMLAALEQLSGYSCAGEKLSFAKEWLLNHRDENGEWDLGTSAKDGIYFSLSDSWRKLETRRHDSTIRIEKLLKALG